MPGAESLINDKGNRVKIIGYQASGISYSVPGRTYAEKTS
jgi:hypothetical protein